MITVEQKITMEEKSVDVTTALNEICAPVYTKIEGDALFVSVERLGIKLMIETESKRALMSRPTYSVRLVKGEFSDAARMAAGLSWAGVQRTVLSFALDKIENVATINTVKEPMRKKAQLEIAKSIAEKFYGVAAHNRLRAAVKLLVGEDEHVHAAAWLRDIIENGYLTRGQLIEYGVEGHIVETVVWLGESPDDSDREDYICRIMRNPIAKKIKSAEYITLLANSSDPEVKAVCLKQLALLIR